MSTWQSRLWTLQEAVMAKAVYIQFKDGTRELTGLKDELDIEYKSGKFRSLRFLAPGIMRSAECLWRLKNQNLLGRQRLSWVVCALGARSTSKMRDEAICIATLLGFGLEAVLGVPNDDEKWPMLLRIISNILNPRIIFM
jgi:hypothetical protein